MVQAYSDLPEVFEYKGVEVRITKLRDGVTGLSSYLLDLFLKPAPIEEAFYASFDLAEELVDRIAFLSFASATLKPISATVPTTKVGEPFDIGLPYANFQRSRTKITSERIKALETIDGTSPVGGMSAA